MLYFHISFPIPPTFPIFVPMKLHLYKIDLSTPISLPVAIEAIQAGFPSPATDYMEGIIDLNKELVKHPYATFLARVAGNSMQDEGIEEGDILVVDKSLEPMDDDLAVCYVDGEFTLKRIRIEKDAIFLVPSNPDYPEIKVTAENDFLIWGIVDYTIKKNRRRRRR